MDMSTRGLKREYGHVRYNKKRGRVSPASFLVFAQMIFFQEASSSFSVREMIRTFVIPLPKKRSSLAAACDRSI